MKGHSRSLAVRLLMELSRPGRHLDQLSRDRRFLALDERERRFLMELCYGAERWRGRLDYYVSKLSKRPLGRLDPPVLWILRLALYQMEFLRLPDRAAVNEAVDSCRRLGVRSAAGFVNALLRRFQRSRPQLPNGRTAEALAVRWSHPRWLASRYLSRYGDERAERLMEANNQPPEGFLWVNPRRFTPQELARKLEREGFHPQPVEGFPDCLAVEASAAQHPLTRRGGGFLIDPGSREIAAQARLEGREVLGDFCAAPGSKSFLMASAMDPQARLHCCDVSARRLAEAMRRAGELGAARLDFTQADWAASRVFASRFEFILLDVPCSGLGTLRSNPDIRWKVREGDLDRMAQRQSAILANAFDALRPGGEILYATCSSEPEENERVVEAFLSAQPQAGSTRGFFNNFQPSRPGDAFFSAALRRHAGEP